MKAKITEIFTSIQGEGFYAGERQVFVRFYGCNLACKFCDEDKKTIFSEYSVSEVVKKIMKEKEKIVSLTGGEPLLQADFLKEVLPILKEKNLKIYLETNGTLTEELLKILDYVDVISMDIKLPSSTGFRPYWEEHSRFLEEAVKKEVFIKAVVTSHTILSDVEKAVSMAKNTPFIVQPVTYNGNIEKIEQLHVFFEAARKELSNVRIIPQIHKFLGVK